MAFVQHACQLKRYYINIELNLSGGTPIHIVNGFQVEPELSVSFLIKNVDKNMWNGDKRPNKLQLCVTIGV